MDKRQPAKTERRSTARMGEPNQRRRRTGQNTLQLQLQMRQAELDALQQMEGESDAAFKARQLAAQQAYVDAKRAVNDYEIQIEQAKLEALAAVTNGLSGLLEELGEDNKAFCRFEQNTCIGRDRHQHRKGYRSGYGAGSKRPIPRQPYRNRYDCCNDHGEYHVGD